MKKYMLVCCVDREIIKMGTFDTEQEAFDKMREDFINIVNPDTDELMEDGTNFDDWGFDETSAWANSPCNGDGDDYDWKIVEV